ncbi:hypothetical protein M2623_27200, partial [Klebsiella pneumoniae]|nr:hypothetical protein [Klebsiella pneumoniae]
VYHYLLNIPPLDPAAVRPGGQLTRHRQQLDQVAKFRSGRQKEINQVANSPGIGSSSTRWPISYVRNQATLCEILAAIPRDYVIFLT